MVSVETNEGPGIPSIPVPIQSVSKERTMSPASKRLLTTKELSRHLQVSITTIWRWRSTGAIPCIKLPTRGFRYDLDAVLAALDGAR
jgi:predicted DNA-binding transcriptional regulator AlpA